MRTNVNLADDARELAMLYAHANGITLGEAITELIRRSKPTSAAELRTSQFGKTASGFPTLPSKRRTLTTEMVLKVQHEEDFG